MNPQAETYEVHYGWHGDVLRSAWLSLVLAGFAFLANSTGLTAVFGCTSALFLLMAVVAGSSRPLAFRVDAKGVAFGGPRLKWFVSNGGYLLPWSEVVSIVVWTERIHLRGKMSFVGIELRPGYSPAPEALTGSQLKRINRSLAPENPVRSMQTFRPINGWLLKRGRLESAVQSFAPGPVRIVYAR